LSVFLFSEIIGIIQNINLLCSWVLIWVFLSGELGLPKLSRTWSVFIKEASKNGLRAMAGSTATGTTTETRPVGDCKRDNADQSCSWVSRQ
jgi:hypothetical protein